MINNKLSDKIENKLLDLNEPGLTFEDLRNGVSEICQLIDLEREIIRQENNINKECQNCKSFNVTVYDSSVGLYGGEPFCESGAWNHSGEFMDFEEFMLSKNRTFKCPFCKPKPPKARRNGYSYEYLNSLPIQTKIAKFTTTTDKGKKVLKYLRDNINQSP